MAFSIALQAHAMFLLWARSTDCNNYENPLRKVLKFHVNNYYEDAEFLQIMDKRVDPTSGEIISQPVYRRKHKSSRLMAALQKSVCFSRIREFALTLSDSVMPSAAVDLINF